MSLATQCTRCLWARHEQKSHHYKKRRQKKEKVEYRNICISRHGEATAGVPVFSLISSSSPLYLLIHWKGGGKNSFSFIIFPSYIPSTPTYFHVWVNSLIFLSSSFLHFLPLFFSFLLLVPALCCLFYLDFVAGYSPSCFRYQPWGGIWISLFLSSFYGF